MTAGATAHYLNNTADLHPRSIDRYVLLCVESRPSHLTIPRPFPYQSFYRPGPIFPSAWNLRSSLFAVNLSHRCVNGPGTETRCDFKNDLFGPIVQTEGELRFILNLNA